MASVLEGEGLAGIAPFIERMSGIGSVCVFSPLEQFEVVSLLGVYVPLFGFATWAVTNLALYAVLAFVLIVTLHVVGNGRARVIPTAWSIALESAYVSIGTMVREQVGSRHEGYVPLIYSLFFFILMSNLVGNTPYSFTVATSVVVSIGLSVSIFLGVTVLGLSLHRVSFFKFFIPSGTPLALVPLLVLIEVVSYTARAFSLGIRLFANMTAGHTLLKILSTFLYQLFGGGLLVALVTVIPFGLFIALVGLELAVSFIQSYVFCILTCSYLKDAIELH